MFVGVDNFSWIISFTPTNFGIECAYEESRLSNHICIRRSYWNWDGRLWKRNANSLCKRWREREILSGGLSRMVTERSLEKVKWKVSFKRNRHHVGPGEAIDKTKSTPHWSCEGNRALSCPSKKWVDVLQVKEFRTRLALSWDLGTLQQLDEEGFTAHLWGSSSSTTAMILCSYGHFHSRWRSLVIISPWCCCLASIAWEAFFVPPSPPLMLAFLHTIPPMLESRILHRKYKRSSVCLVRFARRTPNADRRSPVAAWVDGSESQRWRRLQISAPQVVGINIPDFCSLTACSP